MSRADPKDHLVCYQRPALIETAGADFITCDDNLCKKCRALDLAIWTGNPVAFCDKEGLR